MDQQHVRAELRRRGGFAGLERCAELDTAQLADAEAGRLRESVDAIDLAALARTRADPALPTLDLDVVRGSEHVAVTADERSLPADARPLVALLDQVARPCS
jgi:hypothetical protein